MKAEMPRFIVGESVDHYELLALLGEGAYAEAYEARDTRSGELVVLKLPNPALLSEPSLFQRYQRECEIARRLSHPYVQGAVDDGADRSEPYLVLTYVSGRTLREVVDVDQPLPLDRALRYADQLAQALAYLHANGVVHRDLKPENVLVDADDNVRVGDFGTALLAGARRLTWRHLSENLGTPDYMSPEQVQGERGDQRSDVYAWGAVVYELVTGRPPFTGDNWMAVMAAHLARAPAPMRTLRPEAPPGLEAIVLHALRRLPEHRYASADEILADLARLDELGPASYDLSPEPALGGLAAAESAARLWKLVAVIAVGFLVFAAAVVVVAVALR